MSAKPKLGDSRLAESLRHELEGEVLFDAFSRGRYAADASIYQIEPIGVVVPRTPHDVERAITIAKEHGAPVLPRGAGTSQCGQAVGEALVVDTTKYLNQVIYLDEESKRVKVQPGIVLDHLNAWLKPKGLFFPVDVSPANRATIGGMTGNNSCGSRSIRYGNMVHNVRAINAILCDGSAMQFGEVPGNLAGLYGAAEYVELVHEMRQLYRRDGAEIAKRFPKLLRRVGGYNIDSISDTGHNMADLLVGSEGTLGFFTEIELDLQTIPTHRVLGIAHFPSFYQAMEATQHIVKLQPTAVELVDHTLIELARDIPMFRSTVERFVEGRPAALLLVEFAGEDREKLLRDLDALDELMSDHSHGGSLIKATDPDFQQAVWNVRKAGLNIMMSMKGEGKPVSFVEDCAVPLEDLAQYTQRLDNIFAKYGTSGTWYAHASVGTLHVRPILNLKQDGDVKKMRAIAEECFAMVREYKGSHSGEHGDGLVRSEFHKVMFGDRITNAFKEVKNSFDPAGLFNPGKIVDPPKMDHRELFRYKPGYRAIELKTGLDWSVWGGFSGAVEMCNNNGACRKATGLMCPTYQVTGDEKHVTRGRANSLRLALTGQLGQALTSKELYETLDLCVGCKGCKRECPTGVDMARMKTEFLYHYHKRRYRPLRSRLISYLPRYARFLSKAPKFANARNNYAPLKRASERFLGLSTKRSLPHWRSDFFANHEHSKRTEPHLRGEVVLHVDTFSRWFEPENVRAAIRVLEALGYAVHLPEDARSKQPLCCGRTFLANGFIGEARAEAERLYTAFAHYVERGIPVVGLEPSCLFTFRDEFEALLGIEKAQILGNSSFMFEEFLAKEHAAHAFDVNFQPIARQALVHGHCHQKAFGAMDAVTSVLAFIPDLTVTVVESSCCGMAGAFGYEAQHYNISMAMAEANLLPQVRTADETTIIVADGTSCRHQIRDGTSRTAYHVAKVLSDALPS